MRWVGLNEEGGWHWEAGERKMTAQGKWSMKQTREERSTGKSPI